MAGCGHSASCDEVVSRVALLGIIFRVLLLPLWSFLKCTDFEGWRWWREAVAMATATSDVGVGGP